MGLGLHVQDYKELELKMFTRKGRIWVPSRYETVIDDFERTIAAAAGGYTSYQAEGGWIGKHTELVTERVTVIEFYYTEEATRVSTEVYATAVRLLGLGEESVMVDLDGKVGLVA